MFSTTILDTAIGLVFTFLAVSLAASAITESISSALKWRSKTLLAGVQTILNDKTFSGLAKGLYNHALVNPRFGGHAKSTADLSKLPAYIDSNHFAAAFTEIANLTQKGPESIKAAIGQIGDPQLRQLLNGICDRAEGDLDAMRRELAGWFDSCMDRVAGAYKRDAQLVTFIVALVVSIILNVSAIRVGMALWDQPQLAKSIAAVNMPSGPDALKQLETLNLPIGWPEAPAKDKAAPEAAAAHDNVFGMSGKTYGRGWWITTLLGWFITAGATLFGAPFWYDMLQKSVRLKGTGPSPADKQTGKAAA